MASSSSSDSEEDVKDYDVNVDDHHVTYADDSYNEDDDDPTDQLNDENMSDDDRLDDLDIAIMSYTAACDLLHVTPVQRIIDSLDCSELVLNFRSIGSKGAQALATALANNTVVETLELRDTGLDGDGVVWLTDMLHENKYITKLDLSNNNLGSLGAFSIGNMLQINTSLSHLLLSANGYEDRDALNLAAGLEKNERVVHLDLSHNGFSEEGAIHLGRTIGLNNSIEYLDISWNKIRRKGAVTVCNGLKKNYCITSANLAWNGLGYEGSLALGDTLRVNRYLRELDVSNNRINWDGAQLVAKGLKENDTLEVLKIGFNPLTMTGCVDILEALDSPVSVVSHLGFEGIPISRKILYMSETIKKSRTFEMEHGGLLDGEDVFGRRMVLRCDPLKLLIQYLGDKGIRPVDLFRTFDKDNQFRVTREQFIQGLKKARSPLDDYELERVLNRLDSAKEGKISYQRLMRGVKEQIKANREEARNRLAAARRARNEHNYIMNSALPPIAASASELIDASMSSFHGTRRGSNASSSTDMTSMNASIRSLHPQLISSKTSILSKGSSKASYTSQKSNGSRVSLPRISMSKPLGVVEVPLGKMKTK